MLSLVTAAEQQYRHDTWSRDRDHAVLISIREHRAAEAAALAIPAPVVPPAATPAPRAKRAAWARPIGLHLAPSDPCPTGCAVA